MHVQRIWVGPVHSGKSTHACIMAERLRLRGHDVVLVRPHKSVRSSEIRGDRPGMLVTKTGHKFPSIEITSAREIRDAAEGSTVIWVDEPFMLEHQDELHGILHEQRAERAVHISTLSATNDMVCISGQIAHLLSVSDEIIHCKADCEYCNAMGVATRSIYVGQAPKTGKVKVGGASDYKAACPPCWREHGP